MPIPPHKLATRLIAVALSALAAVAIPACGSGSPSRGGADEMHVDGDEMQISAEADSTQVAADPSAFRWLRPGPAPRTWDSSPLPSGAARMFYPAAWKLIKTDPGTVTAAIHGADGEIAGYLNATPQQGAETLDNWSSFRPAHNREEGDVEVTPLASATHLPFRSGRGACLVDDYLSSSGHRYREIACLVYGAKATTVIVGAAPPDEWDRQGPAIERAISSFLT